MLKPSIKQDFTAAETAKLCGLSTVMLDYLCRQNVISPSANPRPGRGRPRKYSFADVVILRALAALLSSGISVARLKDALATLRKNHPDITPQYIPANYLVTDGRNIYYCKKSDALENLNAEGQLAFVFVIEIRRIRQEVCELLMATG